MSAEPRADTSGVSRRNFLAASAGGAVLPLVGEAAAAPAPASGPSGGPVGLSLKINGRVERVVLDARTTLLDMLRDHLGLTGAKKGCDQGQCGACTVHVDGRRVLGCLTLAASLEGREVRTIEGLATADGSLHPMQQAFIDNDGFQCGYCTPGQIMSAVSCVEEGHAGSRAEIREFMSGNLCRCAAYPNIVDAIEQAKTQMKGA